VVDGKFVPNPLVITDRWLDEYGRIVLGEPKTGAELDQGKQILKSGKVDLSRLDALTESLCSKLLMTFPNCMIKTISSMRKHKLAHWQRNAESNREWLGLNMMTEAKAGFQAFNEGPKDQREVDFVKLRQLLAEGMPWTDELVRTISPQYKK
jgi:6-oxo-cyclohex-1-ene-carbonyl-CoA hydrolase